jgi:hypothetical protein
MWRGGFRFENICFPPLSSGIALVVQPCLRFRIPLIGRVETGRAGRGRSTVPVFQPPPRSTQHADFLVHAVATTPAQRLGVLLR